MCWDSKKGYFQEETSCQLLSEVKRLLKAPYSNDAIHVLIFSLLSLLCTCRLVISYSDVASMRWSILKRNIHHFPLEPVQCSLWTPIQHTSLADRWFSSSQLLDNLFPRDLWDHRSNAMVITLMVRYRMSSLSQTIDMDQQLLQ